MAVPDVKTTDCHIGEVALTVVTSIFVLMFHTHGLQMFGPGEILTHNQDTQWLLESHDICMTHVPCALVLHALATSNSTKCATHFVLQCFFSVKTIL